MKRNHLVIVAVVALCVALILVIFPNYISKKSKISTSKASNRIELSEGEMFVRKIQKNNFTSDPFYGIAEIELLILDYKRRIQEPKVREYKSVINNIRMFAEAYSDILSIDSTFGSKEISDILKERESFIRTELVKLVNTYCCNHQVRCDVLLNMIEISD